MSDALEVRLLRWGESSQAGRTVTFLLPEEGEHPFRGLKTGKEGELFALALARIEDPKAKADHIYGGNDGYTDNSGPKDKTAPKSEGQRAVIRAAILGDDKQFHDWVFEQGVEHDDGDKRQAAIEFIRWHCRVKSRRDLAVDPAALDKFLDLETQFKYRASVDR